MKKLLVLAMVMALLTFGNVPLMAETTEPLTLEAAGEGMAEAVRENPVNFMEYTYATIDWWGEILIRFAKTAKPNVVFNEYAYAGLQITLYDQPDWAFVGGKIFRYDDVGLADQPGFLALEWKGFPLLEDLSSIFKFVNPQLAYTEGEFKLGATYEFVSE